MLKYVLFFSLIIAAAFECKTINIGETQALANIPIENDNNIEVFKGKTLSPVVVDWIYQNSNLPKSEIEEIYEFIYKNCKYPKLVIGIIMRESNFNIFAYRKDTKVYGLGQITYDVWKKEIRQFGIHEQRDLYNWRKNILAINYIINNYYEQTGDIKKALKKYVGQIECDVTRYYTDILSHVGYISFIEAEERETQDG